MKIVQTPARFYPYQGGTEQVVYSLSRELVRMGHSVTVVCADEPSCGDGDVDGIQVKRLPYCCKIGNSNVTAALFGCLLKERFDVMHSHLPHPWSSDISALAAAVGRKPFFLTYHNDITGSGFLKPVSAIYNFSFLQALLRAARVIFITNAGYLNKSGFLYSFRDKIVVAPPGVDTEKFRPFPDTPRFENSIFFLSLLDKFHRYKGLEVLFKALKLVGAKKPVRLYVGGSGELLPYYRKLAEASGLRDSVIFLGRLDERQVLEYYNACDIFVLPSVSRIQEGFGLVALEAMACRKPVVVSDIVGLAAEVGSYDAGMVVKPEDAEGLARAIEFLIDNPQARLRMGQKGYQLALQNYSWQKHAEIVLTEYQKT